MALLRAIDHDDTAPGPWDDPRPVLFIDYTYVGHLRRFNQRIERDARERLRVGDIVTVYGDSVDPQSARITRFDGAEVGFELLDENRP